MKTTKKKSFKRLFAFLMAFVMVTALAANAVFAAGSFTDVKEGDDFYENIESLYEQGIIGGFPDGTFQPGEYLTRQQAAKMIALAANYGDHDGTGSKLVDVAGLTWGRENIWALEAAGVVKGFGISKEFRPRLNITRGHVAKMIALAFGLEEGAEEVDLIDLPADEEVAEAIRVLASNGIVKGFGKSKEFRPDALVTRGQFAKMVDLAMKAAPFRVVDVRALNGLELQITFSKPVDKNDVAGNVTLKYYNFVLGSISDDGRTVVLMRDNRHLIVGENSTLRVNPVKSADYDNDKLKSEKYVTVFTYSDTVAPKIIGVTRVSANEVKVNFSEPVSFAAGALSAKYADSTLDPQLVTNDVKVGTNDVAAAAVAQTNAASSVTFTLGNDVKVDKDVVITFNGVQDVAGNLTDPQPATQAIVKIAPAAAPKIVSVNQESAKTFSILFDQDLQDITWTGDKKEIGVTGGAQVTAIAKVKDTDNEFLVTVDKNLDGLQTITVAKDKAVNLDGTKADVLTKFYTFVADKEQPVATAKLVVGADNKEYIELTFDKDIVDLDAIAYSGSQVKDYVTTPLTGGNINPAYAKDAAKKDIKNVLLLSLDAAELKVDGAVYAVKLSSADVKSDNGLAMKDVNFSFTRGEDGTPPADPTDKVVKTVAAAQITPDKVVITFGFEATNKLDGATATALANYSIAGAEIESVSLAAVNTAGTKQEATLTLKDGSSTFTGVRNITVQGVKLAGSTAVMTPVTINNVSLKENVRPTLVKAEVTATATVKLTFSEVVFETNNGDFELFIGGVKDTATVTTDSGSGTIALTLSLGKALTAEDFAKGIELRAATTLDIADVAGNLLKLDGPIALVLP